MRSRRLDMSQNKTIKIGELIKVRDEVNKTDLNLPVIGINREKTFMPTVANISEIDTRKYKVVRKGDFVFSGMQTGRDVCIRIGLYSEEQPSLMSPAYTTFIVDETKGILSEFFFMYFNRFEMDRYGWFISDSSVRSNLDWSRFLEIEIPRVDVDEQRKCIELWKSLCAIKEENEALAAPLFQLCQSKIQDLRHNAPMIPLGDFIKRVDERNSDNSIKAVKGMSVTKEYREPTSKVNREELANYKIVRHNQFGFIQTTNNEKCLVAVLSKFKDPIVISSVNEVFEIKDTEKLNPDYLQIWFNRKETDRYARFHSWGSARETFTFEDMRRFKVPVPDIEIQRAVAHVFNCAQEATRIAAEADKLSREICPALMQKAIHS